MRAAYLLLVVANLVYATSYTATRLHDALAAQVDLTDIEAQRSLMGKALLAAAHVPLRGRPWRSTGKSSRPWSSWTSACPSSAAWKRQRASVRCLARREALLHR